MFESSNGSSRCWVSFTYVGVVCPLRFTLTPIRIHVSKFSEAIYVGMLNSDFFPIYFL